MSYRYRSSCKYVCTYRRVYIHTHTYIHTYIGDADGGGGCIHTYSHTHINAYRHTERQSCTQRYRHTYITCDYSRRCSCCCREFWIFIGWTLVVHRRMHAHTLACMHIVCIRMGQNYGNMRMCSYLHTYISIL